MTRLTDALFIDLVLSLTNPSILFELAHWSHTCLFCDSLSEMMTPRPLSALGTLKGTSFMWYKLDTGLCVRVIRCALHLDSLNIRPAVADQVAMLLRSSCSSAASVGDFMDLKFLLSSAKPATRLDLKESGRELENLHGAQNGPLRDSQCHCKSLRVHSECLYPLHPIVEVGL